MKKIYLIILLINTINAIGQKYKFTMAWDPLQQVGGHYILKTANYQIDYYNQKYNGKQIEYKDYELKLNSDDYLRYELETAANACASSPDEPSNYSIKDLMDGIYSNRENCGGIGEIVNFRPSELILTSNMTVENPLGNNPHYSVCTNGQLNINATIVNSNINPETYYPAQALHWQYSLDGKKTWSDVPQNIVENGVNKPNPSYNKRMLSISMNQIIGDSHAAYYDQIIFFQLGSGGSFHMNDPNSVYWDMKNITYASLEFGVLYLPCAPVVDGPITYEAPDCSYQAIKSITIPFNRELEDKGLPGEEVLKDMSLRDSDTNQTIKQFTQPVTYEGKTYSFPTTDLKLTPGKKYYITYQSFKNSEPRASINNKNDSFEYLGPQPLEFTITANNPTCYNEIVNATITAQGGKGEYYYYSFDEGATKIQFTEKTIETTDANTNIVTRTGMQNISLPVSDGNKIYNIKVTDSNECIEY